MNPGVYRTLQQVGGADPIANKIICQRREGVLGGVESVWGTRRGGDRQRRGILGGVRRVADKARDYSPPGFEGSPAGGRPGGKNGANHETVIAQEPLRWGGDEMG